MQIFFHLAGKKRHGGKRFRPAKKHLPDFDPSQCAYTPKHTRDEIKARHKDPNYRQTKPYPTEAPSHGHGNSKKEDLTDKTSTEDVGEAIKNTRVFRG